MKVTSLFGRNLPASQGPLGPRVRAEIDARTAELATLRQAHGRLAFAVATGGQNASLELHQHRAAVSALEADIADLHAAHTVALAADNEADAKRRLAIHASRVASLRQANAAREKASLRLGAAIENAGVEYANLLAVNERIASLLGAEGLPADSLVPLSALRRAISQEVYRLAPGPADNLRQYPLRFPGGAAPDIFAQGNPSGLQPLAEAVKEAGHRLLAQIGAVPSASQVPVPSSAEAQPIDAAEPEGVQAPSQPAPEPAPRMPASGELEEETIRSGPRAVLVPPAACRRAAGRARSCPDRRAMTIPSWLPDRGSVILTGAAGSYQSYLVWDAACVVAADGGHVVVLLEHPGASANLPARIVEWRSARSIAIGTRMRLAGLVARNLSPADLRRHVKQAFDGRAVDLIVRDYSLSSANHDFDAWLRDAGVLASENGCAVLTVLADRPNMQPDFALADTVWRSAPFRDAVKQHSMNARLVRERPTPSATIEYTGRQAGSCCSARWRQRMRNVLRVQALPHVPAAMRQIMLRTMLDAAWAGFFVPTTDELRSMFASVKHREMTLEFFPL